MNLILVDKKNRARGFASKEKCHQDSGLLHRAFTAFIINNKKQILIQKRSKYKKLWPLSWEASFSSHPGKGENNLQAVKKRIKYELGLQCQLKKKGRFYYQVSYKNIGAEHELCDVFVGACEGKIKINSKEVVAIKWVGANELKKDIAKNPKKYAPWLKPALKYVWAKK